MNWISSLLAADVNEIDDVSAWKRLHERGRAEVSHPIEIVAWVAARSPVLGWAFASGYREAVRSLTAPFGGGEELGVLCVTERGGNTPRAIETTLRDGRLHGTKTFVTMGAEADRLWVLAHRPPERDGVKDLVVVAVDAAAERMEVKEATPIPFVPEVSHGWVTLDGTPIVGDVVEDGWATIVRPFRAVEDTFVMAAVVSWIAANASRAGDVGHSLEFVSLLLALRSTSELDPRDVGTHVGLEAALRGVRRTVKSLDTSEWSEESAASWRRDSRLLDIAEGARRTRFQKAILTLRGLAGNG